VHALALAWETAEGAAGVLAGYLIVSLLPPRWALALARPALRAMRLGSGLAHAVVAAPAGPAATAALLARAEGASLLEILGAVSLAALLHGLQHWARALAALSALLGGVGVSYALLLLAIALARFGVVCAACRLRLRHAAGETAVVAVPQAAVAKQRLAETLRAAARPAATVAAATLAVGTALDVIAPALPGFLPPWLAVAGIHAASAYAAYGAVSAMLAAGAIGPGDALRALLAGTALSSLVGGWRRLFPQLLPLGARRAAAVTAASQGLYAVLAALAAALMPS
jgi:hypothetical protein